MCNKGLHRICPENAKTWWLKRGQYVCLPCLREYNNTPKMRVYYETWNKSSKAIRWTRKYRKTKKYKLARSAYAKTPKVRTQRRAYYSQPNWRAYHRAWDKTPKGLALRRAHGHKRRARELGSGGTWKPEEFTSLCAKFNHRCLKCGRKIKLTADHVKPICRGGRNVIGNLQPLCQPCNSSKGARTTDYRRNPHPNCLR